MPPYSFGGAATAALCAAAPKIPLYHILNNLSSKICKKVAQKIILKFVHFASCNFYGFVVQCRQLRKKQSVARQTKILTKNKKTLDKLKKICYNKGTKG